MSVKAHQVATESLKAEVGEIDTRAPFESVKAAVSLFGVRAFSADRSSARKPKPQPTEEKSLSQETRIRVSRKELYKLKGQLHSAETTRIQAVTELESAKKTVLALTSKLNAINKSKELTLVETEIAIGRTNKLKELCSGDGTGRDSTWTQELDRAREQYAVTITELNAAKQELIRIRKDFDHSMDAKTFADQQESHAKQCSSAYAKKAISLSNDLISAKESLMHVNYARKQTQHEELKMGNEKDTRGLSYTQVLEATKQNLLHIKGDFDPKFGKNLAMKLAEACAEIGAIQNEMEEVRVSELESFLSVTTDLDGAKEVLERAAEEELSLKNLMESLKVDLQAVKEEHSELKEKDKLANSVVANLRAQLAKCKAELEAATSAESVIANFHDLTPTLQQLSEESEAALQEAELMKKNAEALKYEAKAAGVALAEAEKKLHDTLSDAENAKAAEAKALNQMKQLSEKASACQFSTPEHGVNITISADEYDSLIQKVEESEKVVEMKIAAAMAQVEAVRAGENEAIKRLEVTRKEMEDMATATEEALKKTKLAEAAKKAVEGELRRWREKEHKKAAEAASKILAETQMPKEQSPPPRARVVAGNKPEMAAVQKKGSKRSVLKKSLLPGLSRVFHRKKNQVGGASPSYLPGENLYDF